MHRLHIIIGYFGVLETATKFKSATDRVEIENANKLIPSIQTVMTYSIAKVKLLNKSRDYIVFLNKNTILQFLSRIFTFSLIINVV